MPDPALAGQPLTLELRSRGCGVFEPEVVPSVVVVGQTVTVQLWVVGACPATHPPVAFQFPLGSFPPGNYTLVYQPFVHVPGDLPQETATFSVVRVLPVPSAEPTALLLLAITFVLLGVTRLRPTGISSR